jgi:WD40 repeat protein
MTRGVAIVAKLWAARDQTLPRDGRRVVSASADGTLKIWEVGSLCQIAAFTADTGLGVVAVTPDGGLIVAGDASGQLHFLKLEGV